MDEDPASNASVIVSEGDGVTIATMKQDSINNTFNVTSMTMGDTTVLRVAVLAVIFVIALSSNIFALIVMSKREKLSRMHWFIVHLCIADVLVAVFNVFPQIMKDLLFPFSGGVFLCKLVAYLQLFVLYLSAYILVMTAIDRYVAICHPLINQSWNTKRVQIMLAIAWCLATLMAVPQLFIWDWNDVLTQNKFDHCWASFEPGMWVAYIVYFMGCVYIIPFAVLAFCYGRICFVVCMNMKRRQTDRRLSKKKSTDSNANDSGVHKKGPFFRGQTQERLLRVHSTANFSKAKMKTAKLSAVVMVTYILCWLPFFVSHMLYVGETQPATEVMHPLELVANLLSSMNSVCNPWIYFAFTGSTCRKKRRRSSAVSIKSTTCSRISYKRTNVGDETSEVTLRLARSLSLSKSSSSIKSDDLTDPNSPRT